MLIAGVDTSFYPAQDPIWGVAALVIMRWSETSNQKPKIEHTSFHHYKLTMDYEPGFLGQRECPIYEKLIQEAPMRPDVLFVDGFGILHPSRFGSASRLSALTGIPSIGVAKNLLVQVVSQNLDELKATTDEVVYLTAREDDSQVLGASLKINGKFTKPIFVSVGAQISLEEAIDYTRKLCDYRVPEPIRQADILSRKWIQDNSDKLAI